MCIKIIYKKTRRDFLKTLGVGATLTSLPLLSCSKSSKKEKPNFIVIFTDDQGYGDIGCYGAQGFKTPNLDQMAKQGVRFTNFYVPATVCTPSRSALLTGCYPKRLGLHEAVLFPFSEHGLNPSEITIPKQLKPLGYKSACVGKWHMGHQPKFMPNKQGFDYFYGVPYSNDMNNYFYKRINFQSPPLPLYENEKLIEAGPDQKLLTKRYTEATVKFIQENKDSPFFIYLAHSMPHLPWHVSEKFKDSSQLGLYGDVIHELDWSVGEILRILKETNLDKNTLVIFTTDNGPVTGINGGSAGPLRGRKATTWEGGQRVPCIAKWPRNIPAGKVCEELASTMDFFPTFSKLAGENILNKDKIDGYDFSHLLFQPESAETPYDAFYYYDRDGNLEAIRERDWKLHISKSRGWDKMLGEFPVSLYNLKEDIGEEINVADLHPKLVARLKKKMKEFDEILTKEARPAGQLE